MARPNDQFEQMARDAAARIDQSVDLRQQLSLLPDEAVGAGGSPNRTRGAGRAMSQLRRWLADRGMRLPEDVLAEMAGLDQGRDVLTATMADAERLLAWAESGAVGIKGAPNVQTINARLNAFMQLYTIRLRAADALMPYGAPKATPDAAPVNVTNIVVAGGQAESTPTVQSIERALDVTPGSRRIGPPPMPHQIVENQHLSVSGFDKTRTHNSEGDE